MVRHSFLLRGVRSVRTGSCLALKATGDLFFAGFAVTGEIVSAPKAARKQSAIEKSCGIFVAPKIRTLAQP
jgi:hypothetical protein